MCATRYKVGVNRGQDDLFPARLEDYVSEDNVVRAIEFFVDSLDLAELGYTHTQRKSGACGQPPYPPGALLKLYLYSYLNRIRGSRPMERECRRNIELMWLLGKLTPSYKTIANFRKDNAKALRKTHRQFILLCRGLSLLDTTQVALDGSFFNGNVSAKSFKRRSVLEKRLKEIDAQLTDWLDELDRYDAEQGDQESATEVEGLRQKLAEMEERKAKIEGDLKALEQAGAEQLSSTDKDARLLSKGGQHVAGYNVQIVTDDKHKLIVTDEVTQDGNDKQQLHPMSVQARDVLEASQLEVLADAGYHSSAQIAACAAEQERPIIPFVPEPKRGKSHTTGRFGAERFLYDEAHDHYTCPEGLPLHPSGKPRKQNGRRVQRYMASETACGTCPQRNSCITPKSKAREIWRDEHSELLDVLRQRMEAHPDAMKERSALVEHPFGTLKRRAGWDHFLVRGLKKVRGEWSLMALAYNFTRVLNLVGMKKLMDYLARQKEALFAFVSAVIGLPIAQNGRRPC